MNVTKDNKTKTNQELYYELKTLTNQELYDLIALANDVLAERYSK